MKFQEGEILSHEIHFCFSRGDIPIENRIFRAQKCYFSENLSCSVFALK